MSIFGKLLGTKDGKEPEAVPFSAANQPVRTISYDPDLMESLLRDHGQLSACYKNIGKLLQADKLGDIRGELINFKTQLQAHILSENVRFYTYIEQSLQGDTSNLETLHDFRREMNIIARKVVDFVKRYQPTGALDDKTRLDFANHYEEAGKLLTQRLQQEESSLYPLYQPR